MKNRSVLCVSTGGPGNLLSIRMRRLMQGMDAEITFYDLELALGRAGVVRALYKKLTSQKWDLVYLEGTGTSAGVPLIYRAVIAGQRYFVSSGDPVGGFFYVTKGPLLGWIFGIYERLLYRYATAFVGWTPYLSGVALHLGARKAITVEGAVDLDLFQPCSPDERLQIRRRYNLPENALVCGCVGTLSWNQRQAYCYGLELVETLKKTTRTDVYALIVGDGSGRKILESRVPDSLNSRIIFTGKVPEKEVVCALNAMDIGFIAQTLDQLGSFRLTTKLPEYLACGLPVAMSPIVGFYDYVESAGWPLPAYHPADPEFHTRCAAWLDGLKMPEIIEKRSAARALAEHRFAYKELGEKFRRFVSSLLEET